MLSKFLGQPSGCQVYCLWRESMTTALTISWMTQPIHGQTRQLPYKEAFSPQPNSYQPQAFYWLDFISLKVLTRVGESTNVVSLAYMSRVCSVKCNCIHMRNNRIIPRLSALNIFLVPSCVGSPGTTK